MIGKKVKYNDYKFTYGQEILYVNIFCAFKVNGNRYVVYGYENNNKDLYFGSLFIRENNAVVMGTKDDDINLIEQVVNSILTNTKSVDFEVVDLTNVDNIQIVEEKKCTFSIPIDKLYDITMPKEVVQKEKEPVKKKKYSYVIFIVIFIITLAGIFLFINPSLLQGKNVYYVCNKNYKHNNLPASVKEELTIAFSSRDKLVSIDNTFDYVFIDTDYYSEFKNKSYFYKYIDEADTYKFDDDSYTYRVFSSVDIGDDFFLPTNMEELLTYYRDNGYECNVKEE